MAYQTSTLPTWYAKESDRMQAKHNPGQATKMHKKLVGSIEFANKMQQQTMGGFCGKSYSDTAVEEKVYVDAERLPESLELRVMSEFAGRDAERRQNRNRPSSVQFGVPRRRPEPGAQRALGASRLGAEAASRRAEVELRRERITAYESNKLRATQATVRIGASRTSAQTLCCRKVLAGLCVATFVDGVIAKCAYSALPIVPPYLGATCACSPLPI
jgi:hypothetical protein